MVLMNEIMSAALRDVGSHSAALRSIVFSCTIRARLVCMLVVVNGRLSSVGVICAGVEAFWAFPTGGRRRKVAMTWSEYIKY